ADLGPAEERDRCELQGREGRLARWQEGIGVEGRAARRYARVRRRRRAGRRRERAPGGGADVGSSPRGRGGGGAHTHRGTDPGGARGGAERGFARTILAV